MFVCECFPRNYGGTPLIRSPMGPKTFGRVNGVAILTRVFFFTRKCMVVFVRLPKKEAVRRGFTVADNFQ